MVVTTDTTGDGSGDANDRFQGFLCQALIVALRYVEAGGENAPLTPAARSRAMNLLQYAFNDKTLWRETCELLLALAPKMERAGYREEWLPRLETGVKIADANGDQLTTARFYWHIGVLHRLQNHHAQATTALTASAERFHALGESREQARALNQLGYVARHQNFLEQATTLAHEALALLDEGDIEQAMSFSLLGLIAHERHQWTTAEAYHRQALALREQAANKRQTAWSLQNLANALRGQGKYETAIRHFERADDLLQEVEDPVHRAIVQMNLGIIYSVQKQPFKAFPLYDGAERIFHRLGSQLNLAKVKVNQGLEYMAVASWEKAEIAFRLGADLYLSLADKGGQLNALDGLGLSYLEQGRYAEALTLFERIAGELHEVEGTYFFEPLREQLPRQIARSKAGLAEA